MSKQFVFLQKSDEILNESTKVEIAAVTAMKQNFCQNNLNVHTRTQNHFQLIEWVE